jgi:hypothetical protein
MPPEERFVPRFIAEPPHEKLPYGRWAQRLNEVFSDAVEELQDAPEDLGEPGEPIWYPDRSWHGRTYVPFTSHTEGGYELFGHVRFIPADQEGAEPNSFNAHIDFTDQTAGENPHWQIDLCDEVIGSWRGHGSAIAAITLVWGRPLLAGGAIVTAELAQLAVDQCELTEDRFTLIAPDDYRHDLLEIRLWDGRGRELASESLYEGEETISDKDAE